MVKKRIKTLLIEDSLFMRKLICEIIKTDPEIDLIGYAADGKEGRSNQMPWRSFTAFSLSNSTVRCRELMRCDAVVHRARRAAIT